MKQGPADAGCGRPCVNCRCKTAVQFDVYGTEVPCHLDCLRKLEEMPEGKARTVVADYLAKHKQPVRA